MRALLGQRPHRRHELQVHELAPHLERRDEEVVDAGERRRLRAAACACDPPRSPVTSTSVMAVASGIRAARRASRARSSAAAESGTARPGSRPARQMKIVCTGCGSRPQRVERRQREDGAGDHRAGRAADAGQDDVLEQRRSAPVDAREADRQDRDRDRRLHHLARPSARIRRRHREDDAQQQAPEDRAPRGLRRRAGGGDDRQVRVSPASGV